jgi:hypothetical protein
MRTCCRNFVFDYYGDQKSQITFLMYLNDDFEGGYTSFFKPKKEDKSEHEKVTPSVASSHSLKTKRGHVWRCLHNNSVQA